ncbi:MAG: DNA cytosine methyltransferase [Candidatus Dadabacteria bacterium]|nr:DNA cytosine methyltransferase [Candidatus Dadabacteria bacterium]
MLRADLTAIEICAGAGGLSLGLERVGFKHELLVDNDKMACSTLRLNRPEWNSVESDISTFSFGKWRGVDLLTGGLPCPPYSIAGKGLGKDDERDLFPSMVDIVADVKPRAILIENVRGIMTRKFERERNHVNKALSRLKYRTYWVMLNAADYGTPQNRHRAFLIALRGDVEGEPEWPIEVNRRFTVGDAISDLMAENGWRKAGEWAGRANIVAPTIVGGSKKHGGPDLGPSRARKEWAKIGVDGMGIANEAPAPDFEGMPRLTPRMVARIQSFPDDWQFFGNKTARCRQIGNALPPQLGAAVAGSLIPCLNA